MILVGWVALTAAMSLTLPDLTQAERSPIGGLVPKDSNALRAEQRSFEHFGLPLFSRNAVVVRNPDGLTDAELESIALQAARVNVTQVPDAENLLLDTNIRAALADAIGEDDLERLSERDPRLEEIPFALPLVNSRALFPGLAESGTTSVTFLAPVLDRGIATQRRLAEAYAEGIETEPGSSVGVAGALPARLAEWTRIKGALPVIETATVGLVALVIALTFRALGAALLTLVAAGIAYLVSVRSAAWVGSTLGVDIPREVEPVLVVLLLGIVTDYAVFVLAGARRRLAEGQSAAEATRATLVRTAPIIATAGLIVALGAAALVVGKLQFFRAFGPGLAVTVLVTLVVSLTLIPAAIAVFGRWVFWPSVDRNVFVDEEADAQVSATSERLARFATTRVGSKLLLTGSVAVLVVAALGLLRLDLGFSQTQGLPRDSDVRRTTDAAVAGFAPGILAPTEILLEDPEIEARRVELRRFEELVQEQPGIAAVIGPRAQPEGVDLPVFVSGSGAAARLVLVLDRRPLGASGLERLRELRTELVDLAQTAGLDDARISFVGDTALAAETIDGLVDDMERVALAVLIVNLLLLMIFLRAVVAPLFLVGASILALAASLGLTSLVFEGLLGHDGLKYYVPFAVAVLLLSLGSDYNVFVVGRIWIDAQNRPIGEAIAHATPRAARAITVAGLALAGSFGLLALIPLDAFRQFAFAMSVGILIDTFLVRSLLVPALLATIGEASWWPGRGLKRTVQAPAESAPEPEPVSENV